MNTDTVETLTGLLLVPVVFVAAFVAMLTALRIAALWQSMRDRLDLRRRRLGRRA